MYAVQRYLKSAWILVWTLVWTLGWGAPGNPSQVGANLALKLHEFRRPGELIRGPLHEHYRPQPDANVIGCDFSTSP